MKIDSKIRHLVVFLDIPIILIEMVRVDLLNAIANYGVVSNTRVAREGLTGAIAQTSMLSSANV